jgi:hypothetical protein
VRHQGEHLHQDHQDEDQNRDVRQDRRGEHLDHQDEHHQVHRGVRHQDQDGNQDHQDVHQDQDGNLRHRGVRHQEVRDRQEEAEWGDHLATWGQVEEEWGDHQEQHHLGAAVACQEEAVLGLQEVQGELLVAD